MRNLFLTVIVSTLLLIVAACAPNVSPSASPGQSPASIAVPQEIASAVIQVDFDQPQFGQSDAGQVCLFGWSKTGVVAMVSRSSWTSEKPSSGLKYDYSIIDMVSDKVLWSESDSVVTADSDDSGSAVELSDSQAIAASWQKVAPQLFAKLREYSVNPARDDLTPVPFARSGRQFTASASLQINNDDEMASYYTVSMDRGDGKAKELARRSRKDDGSPPWWFSEITVLGAWLSPYEDRIALVYLLKGRGFEADSISDVRATGCLLKGNF